jgi:hypothetical protein
MKQYVIDELSNTDYKKIEEYLDHNFKDKAMGGLYWIPLHEDVLRDIQKAHADCGPFYFALELLPEKLSCELLVRTKNRMRCDCMMYADESQRTWIMAFIDSICERLEIVT